MQPLQTHTIHTLNSQKHGGTTHSTFTLQDVQNSRGSRATCDLFFLATRVVCPLHSSSLHVAKIGWHYTDTTRCAWHSRHELRTGTRSRGARSRLPQSSNRGSTQHPSQPTNQPGHAIMSCSKTATGPDKIMHPGPQPAGACRPRARSPRRAPNPRPSPAAGLPHAAQSIAEVPDISRHILGDSGNNG